MRVAPDEEVRLALGIRGKSRDTLRVGSGWNTDFLPLYDTTDQYDVALRHVYRLPEDPAKFLG